MRRVAVLICLGSLVSSGCTGTDGTRMAAATRMDAPTDTAGHDLISALCAHGRWMSFPGSVGSTSLFVSGPFLVENRLMVFLQAEGYLLASAVGEISASHVLPAASTTPIGLHWPENPVIFTPLEGLSWGDVHGADQLQAQGTDFYR